MKIAITGGTGFVGRNLARRLVADGHEVVLIARGVDTHIDELLHEGGITCASIGLDDVSRLATVFAGCEAVAHCAGINREIGTQTYERVHVEGTRHLIEAAKHANVQKIVMLSFIRARPDCGSGYHESKFAAEEMVRGSGLDYTVIKAGVIYGRGDHMLDHLSHALYTFPIFGLVGFQDRLIRPCAVEDMTRVLVACLTDGRLSRKTVAVTGPEEMTLREAVARVARVVNRRPLMIPLPLWFHRAFAALCECTMKVPLASLAQVKMLGEGLVEPLPPCEVLSDELAPQTRFTDEQIRRGLPESGPFGLRDCRLAGSCR